MRADGNDVAPGEPRPAPVPGQGAPEPGSLVVRTVPIDDPGDLLAHVPPGSPLAWVRRGCGLVGWGEAARITLPAGEDRFTAGEKWLRDLFERTVSDNQVGLPGTGPVAFASFTFDPASDGSVLIVPRTILGRAPSGQAWLTTVSPASASAAVSVSGIPPVPPGSGIPPVPPALHAPPVPSGSQAPAVSSGTQGPSAQWAHRPLRPTGHTGPFCPTGYAGPFRPTGYARPFRPTGCTGPGRPCTGPGRPSRLAVARRPPDRAGVGDAVAAAVGRITSGALRKVVLARDVFATAGGPIDARILLGRLAARYPDCFTFACANLVGATPELLVRRVGGEVTALILGGTSPRGATPAEDAELGAALLASAKNTEEHAYAVASVRDALGPLCADLDIPSRPSLLKLANVHHLGTAVSGTLAADRSVLSLAGALHPPAAVCGTPAEAALELIRELEHMERGRYAGPVGWVDANGNGEFGIALRCAELDGRRARLFAGCGIVADSDPAAEVAETEVKFLPMRQSLEG